MFEQVFFKAHNILARKKDLMEHLLHGWETQILKILNKFLALNIMNYHKYKMNSPSTSTCQYISFWLVIEWEISMWLSLMSWKSKTLADILVLCYELCVLHHQLRLQTECLDVHFTEQTGDFSGVSQIWINIVCNLNSIVVNWWVCMQYPSHKDSIMAWWIIKLDFFHSNNK